MKKIQILIFAVVAVSALGTVVASGASAEESTPLFLLMGAEIPAGILVDIPNVRELLLEDMEAVGGAVDVECGGSGTGEIFPEGLDEETSYTTEKCVIGSSKGACTSIVEVKAVNLPWLTELLQPSATFEDDLFEGTGGNPGWSVVCKSILGNLTDTCTTNARKMLLKINTETEELEAELSESGPESEQASCTLGKAHSGLTSGLFRIEALLNSGMLAMPVELNLDS